MKLKTESINKVNEIATWFFEKFDKIDKSLARLKKKREDTITNISNETGNTTTDMERIIKGQTMNNPI